MGDKTGQRTDAESSGFCEPVREPGDSLPGRSAGKRAVRGAGTGAGLDVPDILDALPFYVLLVDKDHNILEANQAVYRYLGVKRQDILGKYCPRVIHGLNRPFEGCPLEEAAQKNEAIERELFDPKAGRWVMSAIYPTRGLTRDGKRIFLHMVTDVTERKQAQEQARDFS